MKALASFRYVWTGTMWVLVSDPMLFTGKCFTWLSHIDSAIFAAGGQGPLWAPIRTISNAFVGYIGCIVLFMACFYSNVWGTNNLPFLSQELFYPNGTEYNQLAVLDANNRVNDTMVKELGVPGRSSSSPVFSIGSALMNCSQSWQLITPYLTLPTLWVSQPVSCTCFCGTGAI